MNSFRADFLPKIYTFNKSMGSRTGLFDADRTLREAAEIEQAVSQVELEFPPELGLEELDDILLQYATNVTWVTDYLEFAIQSQELDKYYVLVHRICELGYNIWTTFLTGYQMHQKALISGESTELRSQYKQQINELSDTCGKLETDVLSIVRPHLQTELTEEERKTLELFNKY
jgi:hypothetical protein